MLVEVFPPLFVDSHRLYSGFLTLFREPLCLGVLDHFPDMLGVYSIEDGEEVVSVRIPIGWILIL